MSNQNYFSKIITEQNFVSRVHTHLNIDQPDASKSIADFFADKNRLIKPTNAQLSGFISNGYY